MSHRKNMFVCENRDRPAYPTKDENGRSWLGRLWGCGLRGEIRAFKTRIRRWATCVLLRNLSPGELQFGIMATTPVNHPRQLPVPQSLSDAVRIVIESNVNDGYPPNRFRADTQDGFAPNLLDVCAKLINKPETLQWIENSLISRPMLLTLEDLVCNRGANWGFDPATIQQACGRRTYFDQLSGYTRYV
jgi:hypothetical protein